MLHTKILYSYNDIMVEPCVLSEVNSRKECNPYIDKENKMLPIFTAPMSTVVDTLNYQYFEDNGIYSILPRNIDLVTRISYAKSGKWAAFSLKEFKELCFNEYDSIHETPWKVLIDVANGHMKQLYEAVKYAKELHGKDKLIVMIGNIANPETYFECYKYDIDYVRCGIGGGSGCITSSNTSIHYPMASLINEAYELKLNTYHNNNYLKKEWDEMPKIIADGGIRNYSDVIKALSLGADYVMIGGLFASCIESAGETYRLYEDGSTYSWGRLKYDTDWNSFLKLNRKNIIMKEFYGMASKEGQCSINGKKTKTSEGIHKDFRVSGTVPQWVDNMASYLCSAMSYCNVKDVMDFNPQHVICNVISNNTQNAINK